MIDIQQKTYIFAVDTDSYAGNFERQMCAYMTGHVGESGVGSKEASAFFNEVDADPEFSYGPLVIQTDSSSTSIIGERADERGHFGPAAAIPTPGWGNDGHGNYKKLDSDEEEPPFPAYLSVGIYMDYEPTSEQIEFLKDRAQQYAQKRDLKITGFRLLSMTTVIDGKNI